VFPNIVDGGSFTSAATTGGTITYFVPQSVAIVPGVVVFLGAENTVGEMYMTFSTVAAPVTRWISIRRNSALARPIRSS